MIIFIIIIIIIKYYYKLGYKFIDNHEMKKIFNAHYNKLNKLNILTIDIKMNQGTLIPLNIYQTWYTLDLLPDMKECVDLIKTTNPEFKYYLYDDKMCRQFINEHFTIDVVNAYDSLIPGAYKADLWRYCILYKYGGIYLDIKYKPMNNFKFITLTDKEYFVLDRPDGIILKNSWGLYNALMICLPSNPVLLRCIETIVYNVKNKIYGCNSLHPTGPALLGEIYFDSIEKINNIELIHNSVYTIKINSNGISLPRIKYITKMNIIYRNTIILQNYSNYRKDQSKNNKRSYGYLWEKKQIYLE